MMEVADQSSTHYVDQGPVGFRLIFMLSVLTSWRHFYHLPSFILLTADYQLKAVETNIICRWQTIWLSTSNITKNFPKAGT